MNILFIHPVMFHPQRGGIERVSDLLCREFIRRGHNVLCLHNVRDESRMDYAYPASSYFFPYQVREVEKNGLFFRGFLQEHRIDMVIDQDPQTYYKLYPFSKALRGVYIISVIHYNPLGIYHHLGEFVMWVPGKNTIMGKIRKMARIIKIPMLKYDYKRTLQSDYGGIFRYTDALCLLSLKFLPDLRQIYTKDLSRVIAIPNPNTYPAQENTDFLKKKQILYVGRIEWRQKRVGRLIDIWRYIYKDFPDWELVIVGDGPIRQVLEQKASKMERVVFTGWQDPESFYRDASILCLTSDFEGWGMVLTEAMTFGAVPVAFNSYAAITDIIDDGKTGMLVPPFSHKEFARKLGLLMKDEELRMEMSKNCVQYVKRFDIQNVADEWERTFGRLKSTVRQ